MNKPCNNCEKAFKYKERYYQNINCKDCEKFNKYQNYLASRRKYRVGERIKDLNDLLNQKYVYWEYQDNRPFHIEAIKSWQFRIVMDNLKQGRFYKAIKKGRFNMVKTVEELYNKIDDLKEIERIIDKNGLDKDYPFFNEIKRLNKLVETFHKFGINKKIWYVNDYRVSETNGRISKYSEIGNIGKLEQEEYLLTIVPSTLEFVCENNYDIKYFDKFFKELQEVKPKYVDKLNYILYYDYTNSKKAYEHYEKTLKKYRDDYEKIRKKNKIEKLQKELDRLKGE